MTDDGSEAVECPWENYRPAPFASVESPVRSRDILEMQRLVRRRLCALRTLLEQVEGLVSDAGVASDIRLMASGKLPSYVFQLSRSMNALADATEMSY